MRPLLLLTIWLSCTAAQAQLHVFNRPGTGGLPRWEHSSNWINGTPNPGSFAYFLDANNSAAVYVSSSTNFLTNLYFNTSSNSVSNVNAKFRSENANNGIRTTNMIVGANANRRAFVNLESGTHLASSVTLVNAGSRLDIGSSGFLQTGTLASYGTINANGDVSATNVSLASGGTINTSSAWLNVDGGSLDIVGGTLNASVWLENGDIDYDTGTASLGSLVVEGNSTIQVAAGRTLTANDAALSYASSSASSASATFSGPGIIDIQNGLALYQGSDVVLSNGVHLKTGSIAGTSGNGGYHSLAVNTGTTFETGTMDLGHYGGFQMDIDGMVLSNEAQLRSGTFSAPGGVVVVDNAGSWTNTGHIQVGAGGGISNPAGSLTIRNGTVTTESLTVGLQNLADHGNLSLATVGSRLNVTGTGTIEAGSTLSIANGGIASFDNLEVSGNLSLNRGSVNVRNITLANDSALTIAKGAINVNGGTVIHNGTDSVVINGGTNAIDAARFDLRNGASMNLGSRSLYIGGPDPSRGGNSGYGELFVDSGSTVQSGYTLLGFRAGSFGAATILGTGTQWETGDLVVGAFGDAHVLLSNNAVLTSRTASIESSASMYISDNALWDVTYDVLVGRGSETTNLDLVNGGVITSDTGRIGVGFETLAIVSVSGVGSENQFAQWDVARNLTLGGAGTGTLNIDNGGIVSVGETMNLGNNGTVNLGNGTLDAGTIELLDGSAFNMTDGKLIVDSFIGDLIQDGGVLSPGDSPGLTSIAGDYTLNTGSVLFEIDGLARGSEFDALDITGNALLNGTFDINLLGYTPSYGDSFDLIHANSLSGTPLFDFSGATLSSGLVWNTDNFLSTGTISITAIPEPSSAFLVGIGLCLMRIRRVRVRSSQLNGSKIT